MSESLDEKPELPDGLKKVFRESLFALVQLNYRTGVMKFNIEIL